LDQNQQTTAENLNRIYAVFEQQRLRDLEDMRVGYQDLVDNDYETIRSLQQLAQFVSFQSPER
jgi:acyl-CoA-binding protein